MRYYSITGFYPDDKKDDSLQFETCIKTAEQNEAPAQTTEAKSFNAVEPGELEITETQLKKIEKILDMKLRAGLGYFIGTRADAPSTKTSSQS